MTAKKTKKISGAVQDQTKRQLDMVLEERGSEYGVFKYHAQITQILMRDCHEHTCRIHGVALSDHLSMSQIEALHMLFHKVGRIINGNPNNVDSWQDIAGYAQLVADELRFDMGDRQK